MDVEKKFIETLKKMNLNKKEKIVVAMSGGKDSAVVAYLLKKYGYNIEGFYMDLKIGTYSEECLDAVKKLCLDLKIKLHVYNIKKEMGSSMCYLRSAIQSKEKTKGLKNCSICGVIKKWIMNKEARKLRASKIATGHNLDDEAQSFLLNVFKASLQLSANSGFITRNISNKKFITRIKPLFYIPENEVRKFAISKKIPFVSKKCPCAKDSYRIQVRNFLEKIPNKEKENIIKNFERLYPLIEKKKDTRMNYCEVCGEPSRNTLCKKCSLLSA